MFTEAYAAARAYYTSDGWYHDSDIFTGRPTYLQLTSLSAFWPGECSVKHHATREVSNVFWPGLCLACTRSHIACSGYHTGWGA